MLAYVDGNIAAFDALYRRVAPQLFGLLLRLTRDRARAEDLLQTTFTKIHRARGSYLVGARFLPWAMAIARRSFLDERRTARSRPEDLSPDGRLPEPPRRQESSRPDTAAVMERALDRLPENYREAIQLTKIAGLSLVEAAEVLDATPTAVKLRVHRGYELLRRRLKELGESS